MYSAPSQSRSQATPATGISVFFTSDSGWTGGNWERAARSWFCCSRKGWDQDIYHKHRPVCDRTTREVKSLFSTLAGVQQDERGTGCDSEVAPHHPSQSPTPASSYSLMLGVTTPTGLR